MESRGQHRIMTLFITESLICILVCILLRGRDWGGVDFFLFPFAQLGSLLRWMSLSSTAGNVAAIALYALISLLPALLLLILWHRKRLCPEDALLAVLCVLLFFVLYLFINPGLFLIWTHLTCEMGELCLSTTFYAVLAGYLVLRLLRHVRSATGAVTIWRFLQILLVILGMGFLFLAFGSGFWSFLRSWDELRTANTGYESQLSVTYAFLLAGWICAALPCLLDTMVIWDGCRLLSELERERFSEDAIALAEKLSQRCALALRVTVLSNVIYVLLQAVSLPYLFTVSTTIQVPLLPILFALLTLLLCRLLREGTQLKQDNELFI